MPVEGEGRLGADITGQMGIWYQRNLEAITELAALAAKNPLEPSPALQHDMELIHKTLLNFQSLYVANAQGTAIAFSPAINGKGQATIGLSFADRPYFKELQATRQPVLSEVIVGRGPRLPVVTLSVPILKGERFAGYASGSMDLARIREMLEPYGKLRPIAVTLIDSQGGVVASTVPERQPMMPWKHLEVATLTLIRDSIYHWLPGDNNLPKMTRWGNSFYVQESTIAKMGWRLILEVPVAPLQKRLYTTAAPSLPISAGNFLLTCGTIRCGPPTSTSGGSAGTNWSRRGSCRRGSTWLAAAPAVTPGISIPTDGTASPAARGQLSP